jgi:adenylate kinase
MCRSALLLGRQGSGKGTVGRVVAALGGPRFVSAGEVLRIASRAPTPEGARLAGILDAGRGLPPDESYPIIAEAVAATLSNDLLLDGCPRRVDEVDRVRDLLGRDPVVVIELTVPVVIAVARMQTRSRCAECEMPYGPERLPVVSGRCDACQGSIERRADDNVDGIRRRLEVWDVESRPILRHYEERTTVVRIDASHSIDAVAAAVLETLDRAGLVGGQRTTDTRSGGSRTNRS